jgi:hypothetical protein
MAAHHVNELKYVNVPRLRHLGHTPSEQLAAAPSSHDLEGAGNLPRLNRNSIPTELKQDDADLLLSGLKALEGYADSSGLWTDLNGSPGEQPWRERGSWGRFDWHARSTGAAGARQLGGQPVAQVGHFHC